MVVSAFSHFMATNMWHNTTGSTLNWGIMGMVDQVPAGYSVDTIVYYSNQGINEVSAISTLHK